MKKNRLRSILSTLAGGLAMWVTAGLWHNLILPVVNENAHAHHDGLGIGLVAYMILSFLMVFIYPIIWPGEKKAALKGIKIGVFIGMVWVLPHGLAIAGVHHTSILYEFKNTLYHVFEQGIGGSIIALILGSRAAAE